MLNSTRPQHELLEPSEADVVPRKTCASCTFQVCREEAIAAGCPEIDAPSLEGCQTAIINQSAKRTNDRMESHARAIRDASEVQKAERGAGIFHHNDGGTKKQRKHNNIKELFGEHLVAICEKRQPFLRVHQLRDKDDQGA